MRLTDVNYGTFKVEEPVLVDLVKSKEVQRLKRLDQMGIPQEYYPFTGFSRYEHSAGVMLLLRRLGAGMEEQAAGILHDASHMAFSHVVDWAIARGASGNENLQDANHKKMLEDTQIPAILERHGLDFESITDIKRHRLLESDAPSICADRLDYSLKELHYWKNRAAARRCVDGLTVFNGRIVFGSKDAAETFGRNYMELQNNHWGGNRAVIQYYILSKMLRTGLNERVISLDDMKKDDDYVMKILRGSKSPAIRYYLKILAYKGSPPIDGRKRKTEIVRKKFRYVDPEYLENGKPNRLSRQDSSYRKLLEKSRRLNEKGTEVNLAFDKALDGSGNKSSTVV